MNAGRLMPSRFKNTNSLTPFCWSEVLVWEPISSAWQSQRYVKIFIRLETQFKVWCFQLLPWEVALFQPPSGAKILPGYRTNAHPAVCLTIYLKLIIVMMKTSNDKATILTWGKVVILALMELAFCRIINKLLKTTVFEHVTKYTLKRKQIWKWVQWDFRNVYMFIMSILHKLKLLGSHFTAVACTTLAGHKNDVYL